MSISDEFAKLQVLHEEGTLTDTEFADAKAKVLAEEHPPFAVQTGAVEQDIRRLQIQNEILRLDQNWAAEREAYMLRGRYGARIVPTVRGSSNSAIISGIICLMLIVFGLCMPKGELITIMGILGIIASVFGGLSGAAKADVYNAAYERYQVSRSELTHQLEAFEQ